MGIGNREAGLMGSPVDSQKNNRFTATEVIGGIKCVVILEKDNAGNYREIALSSCKPGQSTGSKRT